MAQAGTREPGGEAELPPSGASTPTLTVAAVARRLGVAPATLRTWARRYGLGPSAHQAGSHRRYSPADVARLVVMRRLTHEGVPPAEAARLAMSASEDEALEQIAPVRSVDFRPQGSAPGAGREEGRPGGGRVVPLPAASPMVRGLARAAMALDSAGVAELLRRHVGQHGVLRTWEELVAPVLIGIGERWEATGEGIEVEHTFSNAVATVLHTTIGRLTQPRNRVPVMLACADEDQHSLPVHAVAAVLAEHGVSASVLGGRVPVDALVAAVRRSGPAVVYVHATMTVERPEQLEVLLRMRPAPRLLVGGRGWQGVTPPSGVQRLFSLGEVADTILPVVS